ncbi:endonuclease MutS2 [Lactococcus lactis]|uniref:Endonuclease MutS2 n=1 Tax=Lactococcus lactis TaxID=1358 RepID=A0AAP8E0N2_9LACT|nr:endonuclease MutS2 [Lactococcus lactis]MDG4971498.1 endonuclease MutS2 [Lactococcus lactis]PFG88734.1 endonuclease MutS2 [Lactococcus lactis]
MNKKILQILEYDKVKEQFMNALTTAQGQQELKDLKPLTDKEKIQLLFDEVADFRLLTQENGLLNLGKTNDLTEILRRLELEASLSGKEFVEIKKVIQLGINIQRFFDEAENVETPSLAITLEKLVDLSALVKKLEIFDNAGSLYDNASLELMHIRASIKSHQSEIRKIMQEMLTKNLSSLSENVITIRNDRQVLPVKAENKNKISGVVHDMSASGQTLYIEPNAVVSLNNKLNQKRIEERQEITRIYRELASQLKPYSFDIRQNAWLIGHIDFVRAKYLYLVANKATLPELTTDKDITLFAARHPLIEAKTVVANDIKFDAGLNTIVITGPNTGGKTITLKTVGLLTILAQSGLPILAADGSRIHLFDDIFADIGDEQSIEQSLSTFSSHMTNIVHILAQADENSLVLFDELGAGTDPKEGAALAIAILENLRERNVKTMASTHYPELKAYGVETQQVINASMEFNIDKMQPTYHLQLGVPGRSNALEISRRLGLPETIISVASQQISDSEHDVNQMIEKLEEKTREVIESSRNIKKIERENQSLHKDLTKVYHQINREREFELEKAQKEAQEVVKKASLEAQEILKNLNDKAALKPHEIIAARKELEGLAPTIDFSKNKVLKKAKAQRGLKQGAEVNVTSYGQRGKLIRLEKDGRWTVQMGSITTRLNEDEFDVIESPEQIQAKTKNVSKKVTSKVKAQLDLRGMRYEEAELELDNYIDQALLANLIQITIVHGIGTGVIREMVQKKLQKHRHIKSYEYAPINAGGSGATIAILK